MEASGGLIRIALDAMGGDRSPDAQVEGAILALNEAGDVSVALYGPEGRLRASLAGKRFDPARLSVIDAPEEIGADESPMLAVRTKRGASIVLAAEAVRRGEADALLTAGPTGALLACGMARIGRIAGIERPAIATVIPGRRKPFVLIDSGANVDCKPEYLNCFGLMGSLYAQRVLGVKDPEVALLNNGAEETKGNRLTQAAHERMRAQSAYRFVGNVEARDVPEGAADVVVTDGFDGNLILKYTEGLSGVLLGMLREGLSASLRTKLGAALAMPALKALKRRMDYEEYGGAPLLGVMGALAKAHGSSGPRAIRSAILQARAMVSSGLGEAIRDGVARLSGNEIQSEGNDDIR